MKRFHVHIRVQDLEENIQFYSTLFNTKPSKVKPDYAKWMIEDPKINFAISTGDGPKGIRHLGLQVDQAEELYTIDQQMQKAEAQIIAEPQTTCCYAFSDKAWVTDPQNIQWEVFQTHGESTIYGNRTSDIDCTSC